MRGLDSAGERFTWCFVQCAVTFGLCASAGQAIGQGTADYSLGWMRMGRTQISVPSQHPSWSPDGKHIAISDATSVRIVNTQSGLLEWVIPDAYQDAGAIFLDNNTVIIRTNDGIGNTGARFGNLLRFFDLPTHTVTRTLA